MEILDVSLTIEPNMPLYPGSDPPSQEWDLRMDEAARYLVEVGVGTVGVDYLSVEPFEDGEFRTHHTLLEADVLVLEGLVLSEVEPGPYFLACLPLKLAGSEGAPARTILIRNFQGGDPTR